MSDDSRILAGIFVGGASSRMHGRPKGLLPSPGGGPPLVERWRRMFELAGIAHVLVGRRTDYGDIPIAVIEDEPPGIGPLGGLAGLLRAGRAGQVIAVACDMPFVTDELVRRLIDHPSTAAAVAPRREGRWEPLFARYDAARALPVVLRRVAGPSHSLQGVLDELSAEELVLSAEERPRLRDWDTPRDMEEP